MNIQAYLDRINYKGDLIPNLDLLKILQINHLRNIPFENLDIHYGIPIDLNLDKIFKKLIKDKRGGFCYELNGAFYYLLKEIGFDARMISARVYDSKKEVFGNEYDHLAIIVKLEDKEYLIDVGFGEFSFYPLKFELDTIQKDPWGDYIIEKDKEEYLLVSRIKNNLKTPVYIFKNIKRDLFEFREMCHYHQTSPESPFTQKILISKPTQNGRITITGTTLKITENGKTVKEMKFHNDDSEKYISTWFNIEMN